MLKRKNGLLTLVLVLVVGGMGVWILSDVLALFAPHPAPAVRAAVPPSSSGGLLAPGVHTEHPIAAAESVQPHPKPSPSIAPPVRPAVIPAVVRKMAPLQVFLAAEEPSPSPTPTKQAEEEQPPSDGYAYFGRRARCHLVTAVDSADIKTPIIGVVDEDLTWNGNVIIARCSEVHGLAQVDRSRERIASEGTFTFILHNPDGPGFYGELVLQGMVQDREFLPQFKSWEIIDGSAGIRGEVIKTDNLADLKLFAATFVSGVSSGLASTGTNVFGQSYFNPNGRGVANLPGTVINPVVGGAQAVLNAYAQRMLDAIVRDGFFIRAPAGKQFYAYITQDIDLVKVTTRGDAARRKAQESYLSERQRLEEITQPRSQRDTQEATPGSNLPAGSALPDAQAQALNQQLERVASQSQAAQARSQAVRQRVDEINAQAEAPQP
jgi:hypothetical protein